jgi:hypothetical protein
MIIGAHFLIYSKDPVKDRAFLRDVMGLRHVDAGDGWLIFALPPAETAVHPGDADGGHELYLLTDDVHTEIDRLAGLGIRCSEVKEPPWGSLTVVSLPGGGKLGMYQPKHRMAIAPAKKRRRGGEPRRKSPARGRGRR